MMRILNPQVKSMLERKHNQYVIEIAQARAAEFVVGLEAGLKAGEEIDLGNIPSRLNMVRAAGHMAYATATIQEKIGMQTDANDYEGNRAVMVGMDEGAEYSIKQRLVGSNAI